MHVEHGRARPEGAIDRVDDGAIPPFRDVGHSLEHDPYPTRPVPADEPQAHRQGGRRTFVRCSPSFAPTGRRSSSRHCSRSCRRSRGSSSSSSPGSSSTRLDADPDTRLLVIEIAAIVGLGLVRGALQYGRRIISGRQALGVEYDLRDDLYSHFLRLFGFYDRSQTGQLMSRATIDLQSVLLPRLRLVFFAQHVVTIVAVTAVLFQLQQLALVAAIAPVIALVSVHASHSRCSATCNSPSQTWQRSRRSRSRASMSSSRSRRRDVAPIGSPRPRTPSSRARSLRTASARCMSRS